ncbi:AAA family ATPase [Pseudomonas syringae]|nr:AAA family ATPase [Pseudomonas syringae]MBI6793578.1 AAA family ATPase [Pseudomonas syringae]MBI6803481.1 AAA family ATPase [Pseudomonas syringae]MBI6832051.1 AAA family ATPase [Pseudomonas syringae]
MCQIVDGKQSAIIDKHKERAVFTKINKIKNFAVFKEFDWDVSVRDEGRTIGKFKKLNIIYGRNYSGKTSLSRIVRSLELKKKHDKYRNAEYSFSHEGAELLSQQNLETCQYSVRVYNKDFVDDNLRWLSNPDGSIKPFAVLGDENITLEKEIEEKENLLGTEDTIGSLRNRLKIESEDLSAVQGRVKTAQTGLDSKLRDKANGPIKTNPNYRQFTYTITNIKADIIALDKKPQPNLTPGQQAELITLLNDQAKPEIVFGEKFTDKRNTFLAEARLLLEKEVKPTQSIQDLINNALLQKWVREGIESHKNVRSTCAFCGSPIPADLWAKLDAHFSKESDSLRADIQALLDRVNTERAQIPKSLPIKQLDFYSTYHEEFSGLNEQFLETIKQYDDNFVLITTVLSLRLNDIFRTFPTPTLMPEILDIGATYSSISELVTKHNKKTETLDNDQSTTRTVLRLDEVSKFVTDISYKKELNAIDDLNSEVSSKAETKNKTSTEILQLEKDIQKLKNKLKDERRGAERVNHYLENHFGHTGLKLSALDNEAVTEINFKIFRGDSPAENLSEGECSLVAFCYFIAKLEDVETQGKELIVWIDDPISSLDSNHIFFVYSLIEHVLASPIKTPNQKNAYRYSQLFISTHNLDFLKYLKKLSKPMDNSPKPKIDCEYFILERSNDVSHLKLMPKYLKQYVTEFNYLFSQVHACAKSTALEIGHESFYNFGNNLRKFLEAYLFYKFPNNKSNDEKLKAFFGGDQIATSLANRVNNELSHLEEIFDRSMRPLDVPEITKLANFVLDTMKQKDPDQYQALLDSTNLQ